MDLTSYKNAFNSVGWFIPPYIQVGFLTELKTDIEAGKIANQRQLERRLGPLFTPDSVAAMVCERYPMTPCIQEYRATIAESAEAFFAGLGHVAVAGLTPVIEGAARRLLDSRGLSAKTIRASFTTLAQDCIQEVTQKQIGAVDELVPMLESFDVFAGSYLYVDSTTYPLSDKTNRHGILHGAYVDADYGDAIGYYKVLGAVDFLCLVSALRATVSWFAPDISPRSMALATYYRQCMSVARNRPALL
ncbi:MAG TPA: hypothetical protein VFO25_08175 [Candidatus Eremiobacteraceae bacterium]|nr:hypothetical protein [Candidatus Eremiobacteraceae bacterium]